MQAAREARDAGFESVGVTGYRNLAIMAARIMDHRSAELALHEGLQYADAIEQSHCRQMMSTTRAILDWGAGRWDAADERARHELVDRGCRRGVIGSLDVIGLVALGRGRSEEARRWLEESLTSGRRIGEVQFIMTPLWALAEVDMLSDGPSPFVVTGTRVFLAASRPADAERWRARVVEHLVGWDGVAGQALAHADGLLRLAAGSLSAARDALDAAVRGWDERGRLWEASWARLDLAHSLMRSNRFGQAAPLLAAVRATADQLGSEPLMSRADELAHLGRGRGWLSCRLCSCSRSISSRLFCTTTANNEH